MSKVLSEICLPAGFFFFFCVSVLSFSFFPQSFPFVTTSMYSKLQPDRSSLSTSNQSIVAFSFGGEKLKDCDTWRYPFSHLLKEDVWARFLTYLLVMMMKNNWSWLWWLYDKACIDDFAHQTVSVFMNYYYSVCFVSFRFSKNNLGFCDQSVAYIWFLLAMGRSINWLYLDHIPYNPCWLMWLW